MKINTHPTAPPLNPIRADPNALPFQSVSMDFITDLPQSNTFDSIMVVVDHDASKGLILIPCNKTVDALKTAKLYHEQVYRRLAYLKASSLTEARNLHHAYSKDYAVNLG